MMIGPKASIEGRAYKFGDDINTDIIYPGKYLSITTDRKEMARHCFEAVYPEFIKKAQAGDIIIAGKNFGCGSSREQAATCLKVFGISAVLAVSCARIFYRNAINVGLLVLVAPEVLGEVKHGDLLKIDLERGIVKNESTGKTIQATRMPSFIMEIISDGGLIPHLRNKLGIAKN